ncbi:MAG: hypothetical protein E6G96_10910 [Alphaproteobacteria bacterium]|nr:MAG: hypothetical protein E6G96_10910 [Alphaproteobacteria bacterium]
MGWRSSTDGAACRVGGGVCPARGAAAVVSCDFCCDGGTGSATMMLTGGMEEADGKNTLLAGFVTVMATGAEEGGAGLLATERLPALGHCAIWALR